MLNFVQKFGISSVNRNNQYLLTKEISKLPKSNSTNHRKLNLQITEKSCYVFDIHLILFVPNVSMKSNHRYFYVLRSFKKFGVKQSKSLE